MNIKKCCTHIISEAGVYAIQTRISNENMWMKHPVKFKNELKNTNGTCQTESQCYD